MHRNTNFQSAFLYFSISMFLTGILNMEGKGLKLLPLVLN